MQQLSTERANRNRDQLNLQGTISELQQSLQSEQQAADGEVLMFDLCCNHLFACLDFCWGSTWVFLSHGGTDESAKVTTLY